MRVFETTTAEAQVPSGWTKWTVLATRRHWLNVVIVAGASITVITANTCQSSVATVSAEKHQHNFTLTQIY